MIAALMTVYHPSDDMRDHAYRIAQQTDLVYICDNSPVSNHLLFADLAENIRYVPFLENLGLSQAFNKVLKDPDIPWQDSDYVIFFDQDSAVEPGHIATMVEQYRQLAAAGHSPGCLGPVYFNTSSGQVEIPKAKTKLTETTYAVSSIITSSMLCTYGSLREIGFWDEHVFLDMADWELCWRMHDFGKQCCLTNAVILQHTLGSGEKKIGPFRLRVGQPLREYYQIRECLYLLGQRHTPLKYRIRFVAMLLVRSPLHLLFLDHRKERLHYITRGFRDFFRGKTGSLEELNQISV